MLAVSAFRSGPELVVDLSEAGDTAVMWVEGSSFIIRDGSRPVDVIPTTGINTIRVTGRGDLPNQSLVIQPGGVLPTGLAVTAGVEATSIAAPIVTSGSVTIDSASITLGADVRTAGRQSYAGTVRVAADILVDAGGSEIVFGGPIRSTVGPRASLMENLGNPYRLALAPHGGSLYASDANSNFVYFVDLASEELVTVDLNKSVGHILLNSDGTRLYAANPFDNAVTVLNTGTRSVVSTINVAGKPEGMAMAADGQTLFVANYLENSVALVTTSTNRVTRTIPVAGGPSSVAAGPDGRLWVASENLNRVSVYSLSPDTLVRQIDVGTAPVDIGLSPDGSRLYVANSGDHTVTVIDTASLTVLATLNVGSGPTALAVAPDGRLVYVVNEFSNNVSVIDTASMSVATTVPVGNLPAGVAISADSKTAYVANLSSLSELGNDARSLTVRTTGLARLNAPTSTVDPLRKLVVDARREIESAGEFVLAIDQQGNLRANGTLITASGNPLNYDVLVSGGWTPVAADIDGGVNTLVLRHSSGHLHFLRMDGGWRQGSGAGWIAPGSASFYAAELAFGADLDGDGVVMVEAAGDVSFAYLASGLPNSHGNLLANGVPVFFDGRPVNYQSMVAGGWTPMAAEADQGINTVVLRHSSGNIHFWRMDADWRQEFGDGWVAPGTDDLFAAEVTFGVDLDGDGTLTIETAGSVIFAYDRDGNIQANGQAVIYAGGPMNYQQMIAAGWRPMAADVHGGVNTVVLKHASGHIHFWLMDENWQADGRGEGWIPIGSRDFHAAEAAFGADLSGDGVRTIEAQGSVVLTYDRMGRLRVQQAAAGAVDPTATFVMFNGLPANYHGATAAGWLVMAAEKHENQNTVLLKHISGPLHFWRMDATWRQVGGDGWVTPGSPEYDATETHFGVDLNDNLIIGA